MDVFTQNRRKEDSQHCLHCGDELDHSHSVYQFCGTRTEDACREHYPQFYEEG